MNRRTLLKNAIKKAIEDNLGLPVQVSRKDPSSPSQIPLIGVYSLDEIATPPEDLVTYQLEPSIGIVVWTKGPNADSDADDICGQIEDLLCNPMCQLLDPSDQAIVETLIYEGVKIEISKTEIDVIVAAMRFKAMHFADIETQES